MIRFGLIGCGAIARRHAELLARNYVLGARLVAVCDANAGRAEEFDQRYGVNPSAASLNYSAMRWMR